MAVASVIAGIKRRRAERKRKLEASRAQRLTTRQRATRTTVVDPFKDDEIRFWWMPYKTELRKTYDSPQIQWFIAALIMSNFTTNIIEKEIDPYGKNYADEFLWLEDFFNILFLIELVWNFYGHAYVPFVKSAWNWFDVLVVFVGVLSLGEQCNSAAPGRGGHRSAILHRAWAAGPDVR